MIIEESFSIAASRDQVAAFLLDMERMSRCMPGVDGLTAIDTNQYEATLSVRLGPIHARFSGKVAIDDRGAPDVLEATASGRDSATGSMAQVNFKAELTEMPGPVTRVDSTSDVSIRGRLGQFGTGVVSSTARTMVQEFVTCAARAVEGGEAATGPMPTPSMAGVIRKGLMAYLAGLWTRVRRRLTQRSGGDHGERP